MLVHRGKNQLFGTQFFISPNGRYGPRPIRDVKNLEIRRKEAGMQSFEEYKAGLIKKQEEFKR